MLYIPFLLNIHRTILSLLNSNSFQFSPKRNTPYTFIHCQCHHVLQTTLRSLFGIALTLFCHFGIISPQAECQNAASSRAARLDEVLDLSRLPKLKYFHARTQSQSHNQVAVLCGRGLFVCRWAPINITFSSVADLNNTTRSRHRRRIFSQQPMLMVD